MLKRKVPLAVAFIAIVFALFSCGRKKDISDTPTPEDTAQLETPGIWTLSTADTSVTLTASNAGPIVTELKNPQAGWNWTAEPAILPLPARISIGGAPEIPATWTYVKAVMDTKDGITLNLVFRCDQLPDLKITSVWSSLSDTLPGPIQHNFTVTNDSNNSVSLSPQLQGLVISVKANGGVDLWRFAKDPAPVDPTGIYKNSLKDVSDYTAAIFNGPGDNTGFLPFEVLDRGGIHGIYVGWEWQIGHVSAAASGSPLKITVSTGYDAGADDGVNGPDVPDGRIDVESNSSFTMPVSYLGAYKGDADDGTNQFKRWFWNNKVPGNLRNDPNEPWTQYGGMFFYYDKENPSNPINDYYWASDEPTTVAALTSPAVKSIGFDCVEIDYGWWGPNGAPMSFDASPALFPRGMRYIADIAHANGYKFHLYFCNQVNSSTKETLKQKYVDYALDCWRSDFSRPDIEALDWMKDNIPNYRYETCNGGGVNKDFATYSRATVGTVTDIVYPLEIRQAFYDSSYALPPAQLSQCNQIGYLTQGVKASTLDEFQYCLRSGMEGALFPAICAVGPTYNPYNIILPEDDPLGVVPVYAKNVAIYKNSLRPLIRSGNLYHILHRADGIKWDGIEYYDPNTFKGAIELYKPSNNGGDSKNIVLKGLDPNRAYTLSFTDRPEQNTKMKGDALMSAGLPVTMLGERTSEIILFTD